MLKFLFNLLSGIFFALLLMTISRFFISADAGMTGGAAVFLYGIGGLVFGLLISWMLQRLLSTSIMIKICIGLILSIVALVFFLRSTLS